MDRTLRNAEQVAQKLLEENWFTREFGSVALYKVSYCPCLPPPMSPCLPPSDSPTLLHRVPYRIPYDPLVQTQRNGVMEGGIIGDFDMEGEIFGRDDPVGGWGDTEERRHLGVCADRT